MKTLLLLEKNEIQKELMRVSLSDGKYLVQSFSERLDRWITQKVYSGASDAIRDCSTWYY